MRRFHLIVVQGVSVSLIVLLLCCNSILAADYFIHPQFGNDTYSGLEKDQAFKTLARASLVSYLPGDRILLAAGQTHVGSINLINQRGREDALITITSIQWNEDKEETQATIDCRTAAHGIHLSGCSNLTVSNLCITGDGSYKKPGDLKMRCGVLLTSSKDQDAHNISLSNLQIFDVFIENKGFVRGEKEVRTANGTQRYGWGIRVMCTDTSRRIHDIRIENSEISNLAHTGIKITGKNQNISDVVISGNKVLRTGGPGIQMSESRNIHVYGNVVDHSGSKDDSRKWGRGSGLWTWGSSHILIERNSFLNANGPGDSAGAHIDFNCDNIILQYNLSANNAGGFCEVLGNTYNCTYRYNVSVNDGHRIKGENGAFQEGKTLWLSGYRGKAKKRKGPKNFYFYNNTIFCDSSILGKIAIDKTSEGVYITNNIFWLQGGTQLVVGDQYKPDVSGNTNVKHLIFEQNLFLNKNTWNKDIGINDDAPIFLNPDFKSAGGISMEDYIPYNLDLVGRGKVFQLLPSDTLGIRPMNTPVVDILGQPIDGKRFVGAILPQ